MKSLVSSKAVMSMLKCTNTCSSPDGFNNHTEQGLLTATRYSSFKPFSIISTIFLGHTDLLMVWIEL